jgi:pyruvate formate lyase activating enzyme
MDNKSQKLKEAMLYERLDNKDVRCLLCNFNCLIHPNKTGRCLVRENIDGKLYSLNYNHICAAAIDPVEKKPLFHFMPATDTFSIACPGCNFKCVFCQNWHISQINKQTLGSDKGSYPPEQIVNAAVENGCKSISYTYTEPTVFFELAFDTAKLAKQNGLKNIFVSNGYMSKKCIDLAKDWLDAINIDLKAFSDDYYGKLCKASLEPVLENIEYIAANTDIWLEITTLIVPGQNDSYDEIKKTAEFIAAKAGVDTPWHISRFYPNYKLTETLPTPRETLERAFEIAKHAGLNFVYVGNMPGIGGEDTVCPKCGEILVQRKGYNVFKNKIKNSRCSNCQTVIAGIFD